MGKTPKVIQKIKLTDLLDIRLELENYLIERLTYSPDKEGKDNLNVNLTKGQGFLRVKHDTDANQVNVFIKVFAWVNSLLYCHHVYHLVEVAF